MCGTDHFSDPGYLLLTSDLAPLIESGCEIPWLTEQFAYPTV